MKRWIVTYAPSIPSNPLQHFPTSLFDRHDGLRLVKTKGPRAWVEAEDKDIDRIRKLPAYEVRATFTPSPDEPQFCAGDWVYADHKFQGVPDRVIAVEWDDEHNWVYELKIGVDEKPNLSKWRWRGTDWYEEDDLAPVVDPVMRLYCALWDAQIDRNRAETALRIANARISTMLKALEVAEH